jgi:hypothetical protein
MRGGLGIGRTGNDLCSIGFVGWLKDEFGQPVTDYRIITTAAHCTSSETQIIGDVFGQPSASRRVGVEVDEAIVYATGHANCAAVWPNMCRYADVAVIRMDDSVASAAGTVYKSVPTTWPTNPPDSGAQAYVGGSVIGAVVGEVVTKVAAVTGQRTGAISHNCVNRPSGTTANLTTLCAQRISAFTDDGDSGGTVFIPYSASNPTTPRAVGTIFQKDGATVYQYDWRHECGVGEQVLLRLVAQSVTAAMLRFWSLGESSMRNKSTRIIGFAAVLVWNGCMSASAPIYSTGVTRIETARPSYLGGDSLFVSISNVGSVDVWYALCPTHLEQFVGGRWIEQGSQVEGFAQDGCEPIAQSLRGGESVTVRRRIPITIPGGIYRVRFEGFRTMLGPEPLRPEYHASNSFTIG